MGSNPSAPTMTSKNKRAKALKWQELVATWNEILSDYWASHHQVTAISILGPIVVWMDKTPWPAAEWDSDTKDLALWIEKKSSKAFVGRLSQTLDHGLVTRDNVM